MRLNAARPRAARARRRAPIEIVFADLTGSRLELVLARAAPRSRSSPRTNYERKVVEARRRRLVYPYEIIRMLTGGAGRACELASETRAAGRRRSRSTTSTRTRDAAARGQRRGPAAGAEHRARSCSAIIDTPTEKVPEGMRRVLMLSDPTLGMGSLAAPECDRIVAAIDLAEALRLPVEWVPVSSGARIAMDSGTENLDATARVVRRIVTFTQAGGVDPRDRARA